MEEQQIRDFVHRVSNDEKLQKELASDPHSIIMRENFSPRVARIVARLVPQMAMHQDLEPSLDWWN